MKRPTKQPFVLYHSYSPEQAAQTVGGAAVTRTPGNDVRLVYPKGECYFITLGTPPNGWSVRLCMYLVWNGGSDELRARLADLPSIFLSKRGQPARFLFVRTPGMPDYLFVGNVTGGQAYTGAEGAFQARYFYFTPALPSGVWHLLGKVFPDSISSAELDQAFANLPTMTTVEQRLEVVEQVMEYWFGPAQPEDGYTDAEIDQLSALAVRGAIPLPLRWWYSRYGRRSDWFIGGYALYGPPLERTRGGKLPFYEETQCVYYWATAMEGTDPPVWGRYYETGARWVREGSPLSEFLIAAAMQLGALHCDCKAYAEWMPPGELKRFTTVLRPLPLPPWHFPGYPSGWYGQEGAYLCTYSLRGSGRQHGYTVQVSAKTEQPLRSLGVLQDSKWFDSNDRQY